MNQSIDLDDFLKAQFLQCRSMALTANSMNKHSPIFGHKVMKKYHSKPIKEQLSKMKTCGKDKVISNRKDKQTDQKSNCEKLLVKEDLKTIYHIYQGEKKNDHSDHVVQDKIPEDKFKRFSNLLKKKYFVYSQSQLSNRSSPRNNQQLRIRQIQNKNLDRNNQIKSLSRSPNHLFVGCEGYSPKVLLKKRPSSGVPITKNLKKARQSQIQWETFKPSKSTIDSKHIEALHYEQPELKPKSRRKKHYAFHRVKTQNLNDLVSGRSRMDIKGWQWQSRNINDLQIEVRYN